MKSLLCRRPSVGGGTPAHQAVALSCQNLWSCERPCLPLVWHILCSECASCSLPGRRVLVVGRRLCTEHGFSAHHGPPTTHRGADEASEVQAEHPKRVHPGARGPRQDNVSAENAACTAESCRHPLPAVALRQADRWTHHVKRHHIVQTCRRTAVHGLNVRGALRFPPTVPSRTCTLFSGVPAQAGGAAAWHHDEGELHHPGAQRRALP